MDIEECGRFYIEAKQIKTPDGLAKNYFDVAPIMIGKDGIKRYPPGQRDHSFPTREEALAWIERQPA